MIQGAGNSPINKGTWVFQQKLEPGKRLFEGSLNVLELKSSRLRGYYFLCRIAISVHLDGRGNYHCRTASGKSKRNPSSAPGRVSIPE